MPFILVSENCHLPRLHVFRPYLSLFSRLVPRLTIMKFFGLLLAIGTVLAFPAPTPSDPTDANPFKSCNSPNASMSMESVDIQQDGNTLNLQAVGTLSRTLVAGSQLHIVGKLGFLTVYDQTFDMCAEGAKLGINCPVATGKQTLKGKFDLPDDVPSGVTVNLEARASGPGGDEIFCLQGPLKLQ